MSNMLLSCCPLTMLVGLVWWYFLDFSVQAVTGDPCASSPCEGTGTCVADWNNGYYCQCPVDRSGDHCQHLSTPCFPPLDFNHEGTSHIGPDMEFFVGLTTRCKGTLVAVTFYAYTVGTFWLDLWAKDINEDDSYTLVFSEEISSSNTGINLKRFGQSPAAVEEGLTVGIHSNSSLSVTLGSMDSGGFLTWTTDWKEGDLHVGSTKMRSSDNEYTNDVYRTPLLRLHIQPESVLPAISNYESLICDNQRALIDRPYAITPKTHLFMSLSINCYGLLKSLNFHVRHAGSFYFDLWKPITTASGGPDYILFYTKKVTASGLGMFQARITEKICVDPGLIIGVHSHDVSSPRFIDNGHIESDEPNIVTKIYNNYHDDTAWTAGVLHSTQLTFFMEGMKAPSLGVMINPTLNNQDCQNEFPKMPLMSGRTPSIPGLVIFPTMKMSSPTLILGVSFYASSIGSFWLDIFRPTTEALTYDLIYKMEVTVSEIGLHHVTLSTSDTVFVDTNDVLGIHEDPVVVNSLRYLNLTDAVMEANGGYLETKQPILQYDGDIQEASPSLQDIHMEELTDSDVIGPPLRLHMEYGSIL